MSEPVSEPVAPATAHFVEKWFQREPEMRLAANFSAQADPAPAGISESATLQLRFQHWGALLHELREAAFELADPGVAAAKRGWWAEELQAIGQQRARHPLGQALAALPEAGAAPWTGLALALVGAGGEARPATTEAALASLQPLALATIAVENVLFHASDDERAPRALAVHWLSQRLPHGLGMEDGARVPMQLLARHGLTLAQLSAAPEALLRDWAAELSAALPATVGGAFLRRARARFDRARLRRLARRGGQGGFAEPPALASLWRAWRAARGR